MHAMLKTRCAAAIVIAAGSSANVFAQNYPERPVRFIIALAAGGSADIVGRLLAQKLGEHFGDETIIDEIVPARPELSLRKSRPKRRATATPCCWSEARSRSRLVSIASFRPDPLRDLAAITMAATAPGLLVINPALPVRTVKELIDLARAKPGQPQLRIAGKRHRAAFCRRAF